MGILHSLGKLFSKSGKDGTKPANKAAAPVSRPGSAAKTPKGPDRDEVFHAGPADEGELGFSITIKDGRITKRKAFRVTVDGLAAFIPRLGKTFPVTDISASGLGFRFQKPRIKCGVKIKMDLLINGGREVEGVPCQVMRHERGVVGCAFVELDRKQEDAIGRIVLEGEKQLAARRTMARKRKNRP
ncbi:Flagellar brake protein YcgR [Pseudodesulfovibrio hydrargyri]|uniref:Flagellar brake protein YcgR n=1 Tax=Pseudodesulfovibrio hydrargyri TaxID=2125990 RepID=A0A1J5NAF7_9BACT|nr:PilZ domain-containing protein [Pseudodesulfovibrio hydrargyri]OIQ51816.1 Flagellar brake protein YcgR [Pseudodesulfovibrio hydrargyri]